MADPDRAQADDRSLDEIVHKLSEQAVTLARQEVELARREMEAKAREAVPGVAMLGAAGLLGLLATGTGTAGLVLMLARRPRPWAAALAVTGLYGGAGAVLARTGIERLRAASPPIPEETVRNVKENLGWLKTRVRSARR
jgi:uncharacterized membrane protein YqjE